MKRSAFFACILIAFVSCKSKPDQQRWVDKDTLTAAKASYVEPKQVTVKQGTDTADSEDDSDQFADYYIVVADTGKNYYALRDKMLKLHDTSGIVIDTMNRYYNKKKDLIMIPEDDSDEIIAGDYYPRRDPSKTLSLEYLNTYKRDAKRNTIALVTGIYENKTSADSALKLLPGNNAFSFKGKVYIGCLH
nr:hypothetical protein [uncultured Mucilaginibacter sp.]